MKNFVEYTNLKRSKRSFQTTAHQTLQETRTISRSVLKPQSFQNDITLNINPTLNINNQIIKYQKESLDTRFLFERVAAYIAEDENYIKKEVCCKFMRHFYSKTIPRTIKQPLMDVPEIVSQIYMKQQIKRQRPSDPPVAMSQGYLKTINCVYYAVQNTLIFIKIYDLLNYHQTGKTVPYIIQQVRNQVINIIQIVKQNKLFPSHQIVLCIIHPWQMQFYAWQSDVVLKNKNRIMHNYVQIPIKQSFLKALHYIFALPLEKVKAIGLSQDGRLFFFDQQGALNQIVPEQQTKFLICKTGRYKIRNFINSSQNTFQILSNKHGKYSSIFNLASNISQITKYLFPSSIQAEVIFCDNKRSLLFGLLRKNIKLLFGNENKLFIVCYDIKSKAKLIHKFSQEYFIQKYAVHIENENIANFAIKTIAPAQDSTQNTNLILITKSGIKILAKIIPNEVRIVQIIRPPDYRMFDTQIDFLNKTNLKYVPRQKNQYNLCSFLSDQNRTICTLTKDKGMIFTYISNNFGVSSTIDANLQINCVDLQIYKAGSWDIEIYKINQNLASHNTYYYQSLYTGGDGNISQLSSQTISSPSCYLFLSTTKLQLLIYLRPVDVVFTTLLLSSKQPQIRKMFSGQLIPKQKLLIKLFIMPQQQYSIVGPHKLTFEQLSAMILQILVDQNGVYWYSKQLATELIKIWVLFSAKEDTSKLNDKSFQKNGKVKSQINVRYQYGVEYQNNNQFNQQYNRRQGIKIQSTVQNQIIPYQKIHQKNKYEARQILQSISIFQTKVGPKTSNSYQIFYQLPSNQPSQPVSKSQIIKFKLTTTLRYLSLLLSSLWRLKLDQIDQHKTQIQCMQIKLQGLHKYAKQLKQSIFVYDSLKGNQSIQVQINQLLKVISRVKEFLMLIENVKIMNKNIRFGEAGIVYVLDNPSRVQIFYHKQMEIIIPHFYFQPISQTHHTLWLALVNNQQKKQPHIKILPQYFIHYLRKIRGFKQQDLKQLLNTKQLLSKLAKQQSKGDPMNDWDDFNFQIPNKIKEIVDKYSRVSPQINQNDLQVILAVLTSNNNIQTKLTIANKQAIISFIQNNSILHPKLQFIAKFISIQYELYRFYLDMFTPQPKLRFNFPFLKAEQEQQTKNQQTILLLKYNTIIDADMLKKLVFATNDLWMMNNFCVCFYELSDFRTVFKSVSQDYNNEKNNKYSNFAAYIQRYMLNFALKTKFDDEILKIACRVIDEKMQSQASTRKMIKNWVRFNSLTSITDKLIWLPKIAIKIGYKPENLLQIYLSQLQMSFNNSVLLQNQILYCIQFLTCYTIAKQYPTKQNIQFSKIVILHLDSLERNKAIDQSTKKGIKKMIDELLC